MRTGQNVSQKLSSVKMAVQNGTAKNRQAVSTGNKRNEHGGASRDRTDDLIVANDALSQLSYSPKYMGRSTGTILPAPGDLTKCARQQWGEWTCLARPPDHSCQNGRKEALEINQRLLPRGGNNNFLLLSRN